MTVKTLPAHGTEARYQGSSTRPPCHCAACTRAVRLGNARRELNRLRGQPNLIDAAVLQAHIATLTASGMNQTAIATAAAVNGSIISNLMRGKIRTCRLATARRILAVRPATYGDRAHRPVLAAARRIQALYAIGHGPAAIAADRGLHTDTIAFAARMHYQTICARVDAAIADAYRELASTPGTSFRAKQIAQQHGWAPPGAWDDDAIGDPNAKPDWTGHCGTDRGWWLHRANNIPTCQPCTQAHQEWCDQHKHLDGKQRWAAASKARAEAASRGVAIAANARELFTQGYTTDQAALRLGVGRDRIEQELRRHPNATNELEAAA